jgi:hypothetical protein
LHLQASLVDEILTGQRREWRAKQQAQVGDTQQCPAAGPCTSRHPPRLTQAEARLDTAVEQLTHRFPGTAAPADELARLRRVNDFLAAVLAIPHAVRDAGSGQNRVIEAWATLSLLHTAIELGDQAPDGLRVLLDAAVTSITLLQQVYQQVG